MYSIDFIKLETHGKLSIYWSDFWHPYGQRRLLIKKTERSDATILGIFFYMVIWKAQVEYNRKFSHHEETKITKQRQNILSFSLRVLRALRGEKCLA